ncbi:MAG: glycosyltransferase [Candidatus Sumerlaeia bacterium]|nr:glycosyltransferase [Candidatus Sumerlaeia bacterium]
MQPRPRILEIIYGNTLGGAEVLLREMLRVADAGRFEWHLCVLRRGAALREYEALAAERPVTLHHVPCGAGLDPLCLLRLTRLMRRLRPDVVHTHLFRADVHGRWAARRARVPAVLSTIHVFSSARSRLIRDGLDRITARWADRIIGCTQTVTDQEIHRLRLPPGKAITIPNGAPLGRFTAPKDPGPLRREFGIAPDERVIGTVGRLNPEKNHADFLRMARRVLDQRPDVRFVIVGDGQTRASLERLASDLRIAGHVVFTGPRSDIPVLMALFDAFVLSSLWEASPITLLEAMASGVPCIAADAGGCRDLVKREETGWLVPPRDPEALAAAVLEVLAGGDHVREIASRARQRVLDHHSIEQFTRAHEALYQDLLRSASGRSGH